MAVETNPLTEQHYQVLKAGIDSADSALAQIEKAKRAGLDVSQHETNATKTRQQLNKIKDVYFPGRP